MSDVNHEALAFLTSRRSHSPKLLTAPVPDRAALSAIIETGLRVPDHGAVEPWRVLVYAAPAVRRLGEVLRPYGEAEGIEAEKIDKSLMTFAHSPLMVAVVLSPKPGKIPVWEQQLSAGAACLGIVNAALASGWGAGWVTGWASENRGFLERELGLAPHESIAGFIHIGTGTTPPKERVRPNMTRVVEWIET